MMIEEQYNSLAYQIVNIEKMCELYTLTSTKSGLITGTFWRVSIK